MYVIIATAAFSKGFKGEVDDGLPEPRRKCQFTLYLLFLLYAVLIIQSCVD